MRDFKINLFSKLPVYQKQRTFVCVCVWFFFSYTSSLQVWLNFHQNITCRTSKMENDPQFFFLDKVNIYVG